MPKILGSLTDLEHVRISGTNVYGEMPEELGNLSALQNLALSRNKLTGDIPPSFSGLSNLAKFEVENNDLSGKIPLLSSTLTECLLAPGNSFTCSHPDNTICIGSGVDGISYDH